MIIRLKILQIHFNEGLLYYKLVTFFNFYNRQFFTAIGYLQNHVNYSLDMSGVKFNKLLIC